MRHSDVGAATDAAISGSSTAIAAEGRDAGGRRDRAQSWVAFFGVAVVSLTILAVLNPPLLLTANTPAGGDMGAHVLGPAFLRDELIPNFQFQGWSNSWFAGFPIFYFYFPLPSLTIVFLDLFLPYGVAFKLVTVMGLVALPPATYFFVRAMRFGKAVSTVAAAAGGAFVFLETPEPPIFGGTIASTLAGEFSYSWSFALAITYLGLLIRAVRDDRKYLPWAIVVLALTALSHVITTIGIVVASIPVLLWRRGSRTVPVTWTMGFSIAAFWALPLMARLNLTTDMNWQPLAGWDELTPFELWPIVAMGIVGMIWALRITPRAVPLAFVTLLPVPAFFFLEQGSKLWNGRVLPHWYYGMFVFAGIAVGLVLMSVARRVPEAISAWFIRTAILLVGIFLFGVAGDGDVQAGYAQVVIGLTGLALLSTLGLRTAVPTRVVLPVVGVLLFLGAGAVGITTDESYVDGWARWNYSGYEGKDGFPEYERLMETVGALPNGRVQWEANNDLNSYGTPMALMLFPYWTEGANSSMEGLFFESSLTTPFHFLNAAEMSNKPSNPIPGLQYHVFDFDRGIEHMKLFNVDYYVAFTDEATERADLDPRMDVVGTSPPFTVFSLPESSLVDVATTQPWVYNQSDDGLLNTLTGVVSSSESASFVDVALDWYERIELLDQWVVADGPEDWERVGSDLDGTSVPLATDGEVSNIELTEDRMSFHTTAIGVPHLVKVSYFPNWTATGAEGPYRATPSLMVVIPTQENVTLEFRSTWAETGGIVLAIIGVLGVAGLFARARSRQ
ncbi:MAG: hypothetical protein OEM97_01520 [Acidimicrobiia bacterium]|nr:hypothetical protein [Acidimicrobiia bacterium]